MRRALPLSTLTLALSWAVPPLGAQTSGGLRIEVVDGKGLPLPGQEQVLESLERGERRVLNADAKGVAAASGLLPGRYRVEGRDLTVRADEVSRLRLAGGPAGTEAGFPSAQKTPPSATVQVTATRFPEDPARVPASVTVISGQELLDRGVRDLRGALALAAGVQVAPGGDGGPASSIPAFYGLKEMDAFLLVVDGVPWGGAFNPALSTLDLQDVERIEVQRGAAPVMYGATSFVGVIHVIHKLPADTTGTAQVAAGSHGSASAALSLRLPSRAGLDSSLSADLGRRGFDDPRMDFRRSHLLWRNRMNLADGSLRFDVDAVALDQHPGSPHPRSGKVLDPRVPLDANHNPAGAFLNDRRVTLGLGYDRALGSALWSSTLSLARSRQDAFRGFLTDAETFEANGWRERVEVTDAYFDTHLAWSRDPKMKVVLGLDHLRGQGSGRGGDFDYTVNLDGSQAPGSAALPPAADIRLDDQRDFSGLYGFLEWSPADRLVLEGGLRLNHTRETRDTFHRELDTGETESGRDARTTTRLAGSLGLSYAVWRQGPDHLTVFTGLRNTFKPAAFDFGVDSGARILSPETARSMDLGLKGSLWAGRLWGELSAFRMDFDNLVVANSVNGTPTLQNSGRQRFQGVEASLFLKVAADWALRLAGSSHDARFTDSVQDFGGVPTQLRGKRLEMSPYQLAAFGLVHAPATGLLASLEGNYTGGVYLNKRNTAPTGGHTTLRASLGWRRKDWEVRVTCDNLGDKRDPVAESELGDAQYYRLPGRHGEASLRWRF